mgnify:CR=1 FL=1
MNKLKLTINHLYSQNLNIYGDLGNIITLEYRAKSRNIDVEILHSELGDNEIKKADIYFIGGGQDNDQILVFKHLLKFKDFIQEEVESGKVFLLICGGYQLFGKFFIDANNNLIEGLGILDIETTAPGPEVKSRCIGNLVVELDDNFIKEWNIDTEFSKYIVGFENHGGQTNVLSDKVKPLGNVLAGFGNNYFDKKEGCVYKNIIGSYCHGSLLPKNPHLADAIIRKAMKIDQLGTLDDEIEKNAHNYIIKKYS